MPMATMQTDYSVPSGGLAGDSADVGIKDDAASYNAEASASMPFGVFVKLGTGGAGHKLLAAVTDIPDGVTLLKTAEYDKVRDMETSTGNLVAARQVPIRRKGRLWVRVEGTIAIGDRPHVRCATGSGGSIMGVSRAAAVAGETRDCTMIGQFRSANITDPNGVNVAVLEVDMTGPTQINMGELASFTSTEQTGTGSSQNVAHGLPGTPRLAWWALSDLTAATVGQVAVVPGAHDATNLKFTVTTGKKFFAFAIL